MPMLSRHLPPAPKGEMSLFHEAIGWSILSALLAGVVYLIIQAVLTVSHFPPISLLLLMIGSTLLVIAIKVANKRENKRLEKIRQERAGENICSFRRSFDVRKVDPWIIRATYEEFRNSLGIDYPIRADDRLEEDLKIDGEDFEEAGNIIAARAGYSLEHTEQNPYYGKINTVRDFVMFLAHQPCTRKS